MRVYPVVIALSLMIIGACSEDAPPVSTEGPRLFADQQFYPTLEGSSWVYRLDSAGVVAYAEVRSHIVGERTVEEQLYAVQANEIRRGSRMEVDTQYIRKSDFGVMFSSPGLIEFNSLPSIPGFPAPEIPKEYLALPFNPGFQATWDILNIEYNILFFNIYFRVKGRYIGPDDVSTSNGVYRNCSRVSISIEGRFPNLENPQDILNPLLINEKADFWFSRAHGLVVVDGSEAVFLLFQGALPLASEFATMRQEVTSMQIRQPSPACSW